MLDYSNVRFDPCTINVPSSVYTSMYVPTYVCTLSCAHKMNLVLTFIINYVHCSTVWHSRDNPHCLHFWGHCQFSSEVLHTLSGAVVDCAVFHCGHATAYLKNGMPLSTLVVSGTYTGGVCKQIYMLVT